MKTRILLLSTLLFFSTILKANNEEPKKDKPLTTTLINDSNFEQALIDLGYDTGSIDGSVPTANISGVTDLNLQYLGIEKLDGIEAFAALENFVFSGNAAALTTVDLTLNSNLITINVSGFPNLSNFNVSGLANVSELTFLSSVVTSLDVSSLVALTKFQVLNHSLLTSINMKNGFNTNITLLSFNQNPLLSCVTADAGIPALGLSNWTNLQQVVFDANCSQAITYAPDDNFEAFLEANSMGNGIANDDKIFTSNINTVTNLTVIGRTISHLTGIEDFIALEILICSNNNLSEINISQNSNLKELTCDLNQLLTIDVSQNINLEKLLANNNQLKILDVSKNLTLTSLNVHFNELENLDVSVNTSLLVLQCNNNKIATVLS